MKLESDGILIQMSPFNERDSIALVFSRDFGILRGVMRAAQIAKKNRPLVGQIGNVAWNARLDTQLGTFHWEAAHNLAAPLMLDGRRLAYMNAAFSLIAALVPEREQFAALYDETHTLMRDLGGPDIDNAYLNWEIKFLRDLGYALDLGHCSGCGKTSDLVYLSPRTGRAVCQSCGMPYAAKLYTLPITLTTTLYFLDSICAQQGATVPRTRMYLVNTKNPMN